jgi:hypothetical protein
MCILVWNLKSSQLLKHNNNSIVEEINWLTIIEVLSGYKTIECYY